MDTLSESTIVQRLLAFGATLGADALVFACDSQVGDLLKDDPFAFLLAASIDRGMKAENAWRLPGRLRAVLGHLDPSKVAAMSEEDLCNALNSINGRPRYMHDAPKTIHEVAKSVAEEHGGDARRLWRGKGATEILARLMRFHGVGPGIAHMVINLLHRLGEIELSEDDYRVVDVKSDINVKRVFERAALVAPGSSHREVVAAARRLNPSYPGQLDAPAWRIGRTWCHAQGPSCGQCPLGEVCTKQGVGA
jgi:endonuclease III